MAARTALAKDGFTVVQGEQSHFFALYDENAYRHLPSFISTDVVLHVFHTRFDEQLAQAEVAEAAPALKRFARAQLDKALALWPKSGAPNPSLEALTVYHAVALALATDTVATADPRIAKEVAELVEKVKAAAGPGGTDACGEPVEYSLFRPRGHYQRHELAPFFRASSWYAQCAFPLRDGLPHALDVARLVDDASLAELQKVRRLRELLAGPADDVSLEQLRALGPLPAFPAPLPAAAVEAARKKLEGLPQEKVPTLPAGRGPVFRLLGQSGTVDSAVLDPKAPTVLQVLNAMGAPAAHALLGPQAPAPEWEPGPGLVGQWLEVLRALVQPQAVAPPYAKSDAWQRRTLVSAAGSWAELRHDTLLYVKQPLMMAEGGDHAELPASKVGGYVDPRPDVYRRLGELSGKLQSAVGAKEDPLKEFIDFLVGVSELELSGKPFPKETDERLRTVGSELEGLTRTHGDRSPPEALVADVLTVRDPDSGEDSVFHAAVGDVDELWVVVPRAGKQVLMRGGAFSYYELMHPTRLNDSTWNELRWDHPPPRPSWAPVVLRPPRKHLRE